MPHAAQVTLQQKEKGEQIRKTVRELGMAD